MTAIASPLTSPSSSSSSLPRRRRDKVLRSGDGKSTSTERTDRQRHDCDSVRGDSGAAIGSKHEPKPDSSAIADPILAEPIQEPQPVAATTKVSKSKETTLVAVKSSSSPSSMSTNQVQPVSVPTSTSSPSTHGISDSAPSLQSFTHSAPATVTSFGSQQSAGAPHFQSAQQNLQQDYSPYSQYHHQQLHPPPMYGPGEGYSPSENRLAHGFGASSTTSSPQAFNAPQHYYHSSVPTTLDDLRHSHHSVSRSATAHQPYYVPSQPQRAPVYTTSIGGGAASGMHPFGGSSIITANPDSLPDLRYSEGMSAAAAAAAAAGGVYPPINYGRLPNGKIIELYPAMMRTIQACEYCRSRKAKCSGGLPCERCKKKNMKCEYAQLDKKRKVKTTTSEVDMSTGMSTSSQGTPSVKLGLAPTSASTSASGVGDNGTSTASTPALSSGVKTRAAALQAKETPLVGVPLGRASATGGDPSWNEVEIGSEGPFGASRASIAAHNKDAYSDLEVPLSLSSAECFFPQPERHSDSDSSDGGSLHPLRFSPSTSDDSLTLTPAQEHVMPDALWSDVTLTTPMTATAPVAPWTSDIPGRTGSYYDETIQRAQWYMYD